MDAPTKVCSICAADLRGQKRIKDDSGFYFCHPCWNARAQKAKDRQSLGMTGAVSNDAARAGGERDNLPVPSPSIGLTATNAVTARTSNAATATSMPVSAQVAATQVKQRSKVIPIALGFVLALSVGLTAAFFMKGRKAPDVAAAPSQSPPAAKSASADVPSLKDDPAASFEAFSKAFVEKGKALSKARQYMDDPVRYSWTDDDPVSINVTKTDSLMSPFIGTITGKITTSVKMPDGFKGGNDGDRNLDTNDFKLTFAAQGNRWVLKSTSAQSELAPGVDASATLEPFMAQVYSSVGQ